MKFSSHALPLHLGVAACLYHKVLQSAHHFLSSNQISFSVFRTQESASTLCNAHAVTCHLLIGYYTCFSTAVHAMRVAVDTFCEARAVTCHVLISY